jgi:hypothetical protein
VERNSTKERLGREDYTESHVFIAHLATIQGLAIICEFQELDPEIKWMLQTQLEKIDQLRKSIENYFEENRQSAQ